MTKVNLDITTYHNGDEDENDGPWSYRGTTSGHIDRIYVSYDEYNYGYRGMETDLEPPFFVVYAEYETGGTFGLDYEAAIVGVVKTEEEANALAGEARHFTGFGTLSNGYRVVWTGYFERLINVGYDRIP